MAIARTELAETLDRALAPRAVAIYGASGRRLGSQGARIAAKLLATGYDGRVALVNPNAQEVHGVATVPSAGKSTLAGELDLAIISVPREAAADALADCAAAGIRLAIVTSAKFAEADARGVALQRQLAARAQELGVRLIGPNCMGLINFSHRLVAAGRELEARPGRISVVAQSGYLSMRMMDYIRETGQGIDLWVTMGNCCDLKPADMIEYAGARSQTGVIVVYLESVSDPGRLAAAIRSARAADTEVVLLKAGRTTLGSQVAASHTGALASPDVFVDVLAQDADCIRVGTVREAAQVASLVSAFGRRPTGPFLVTSGSGGDCVLAGDWCAEQDIPLAALAPSTLERVHQIVPEAGEGNPIDISPFPFDGSNRQLDIVSDFADDPGVGCIVLMDGWGFESDLDPSGDGETRRIRLDPLAAPGQPPRIPVIVDSRMIDWQRDQLVAAGLAVTSDGETIWRSLGHIVRQSRVSGALADAAGPAPAGTPETPAAAPARLPELEAFARLGEAGLPMVATERVRTPDEVLRVCQRLRYPVVMKGLVPGVVHKADRQLVHVDVCGDESALAAWRQLSAAVAEHGGEVVVQPQLRGALAEIIVATRDDSQYGLHVMIGGGGRWVESDSDVAWAAAPVTPERAARLIRRTRIGRGLSAKYPQLLEADGLPAAIAAVSRLAAEWRDWASEIEINPLMVLPDGWNAVDAVVTVRGPGS